MSRPEPETFEPPECKHPILRVHTTHTPGTSPRQRCALCGAKRTSWSGRWGPWKMPPSGKCFVCGCTEDRACLPPCSWANEQKTRCSACPVPT